MSRNSNKLTQHQAHHNHGEFDGSILIKDIGLLVTSRLRKQVLEGQSMLIDGNKIKYIGPKYKWHVAKTIEGKGKIVLPGFINTHHHLFQSFLRHVPAMQNQPIDHWIASVSSLTKKMDAKAHYFAALANMYELILSGCTTTADMLYIFPNKFDHLELFKATIEAAKQAGMRFHPFRGSMSLGKSHGSLFDDSVVEESDQIVSRTESIIKSFHQSAEDTMLKVGIAPCTIFTSSASDFRDAADLAKEYNVNLQTHLSESLTENQYAKNTFGLPPLQYLQSLGWDDERVSWVHGIETSIEEFELIKSKHQSVCHCPISNARSAIGQTGVAPIYEMIQSGINVALGVDGSAGNDSSNMLEEMRWARTLPGVSPNSTYLNALDVIWMATRAGAKALRWDSTIGSLEVGKCADLVMFDLDQSLAHLGAWDTIGSLVSCQALQADTVIVNGKQVVENQNLIGVNLPDFINEAREYWQKTFAINVKNK